MIVNDGRMWLLSLIEAFTVDMTKLYGYDRMTMV